MASPGKNNLNDQPYSRATHTGFSDANTFGNVDLEKGKQKPQRRTLTLAEAPRHASRGRVIAVSRRTGQLPTVSELAKAEHPVGEDVDDHFLTLPKLAERYKVELDIVNPANSKGLSEKEAQDRLARDGLNQLTPPKEPNFILQFLGLLAEPLTIMLMVAATVSLVSQIFAEDGDFTPVYLGCVLFFVTFANTTVDFVQARKSAAMVKSLSALAPAKATVIRDGVAIEINASHLAIGDLTMLKSGDKIPADMRLIKVTEMTVDNSQLTGEGDPQKRSVKADNAAVLEAENLIFMGTTVVAGAGIGMVIKRGDATVLGNISALAGVAKDDMQSPLTKEIKAFVLLMGGTAFIIAVILFGIGMGRGNTFINSLSLAIGVFVAFALCGMPATVTMLLAYASQQLAKHNVLVKNLHAMDTLGAITLLCSDKTGTLTMNLMTVVEIWRHGRTKIDRGALEADTTDPNVRKNYLKMCMSLCNSANFVRTAENLALPLHDRATIGDATETAMLKYVTKTNDVDELRIEFPPALIVPFSSENKWAAGVFEDRSTGSHIVYLKGAPERVFRRCDTYIKYADDGSETTLPIDQELKDAFQTTYERMAGKGQRVIACSMLRLDKSRFPLGTKFEVDTFPSSGLTFLGLSALQDPPKPGVTEAIDECNTAGIQVMMITGDHPLTAEAIAREIHIIKGKTKNDVAKELKIPIEQVKPDQYDAVVLHGETLAVMSEDEWAEALLKKEVVFARTSPQQKLEIVTRSQAMGHIVAMMGDGVNDSPALRRADMGIAMAITGSEVSREAASLVLLDDNFCSVIVGIKRGRIIFSNMRKAVCYTLAHITGEVFPAILLLILGLPLGMSSFLILFIDLGTEIAPVMSFAFEVADPDVMLKPPRRAVVPKDVIIELDEEKNLQELTHIEIAEANEEELEEEADRGKSTIGKWRSHIYHRAVNFTSGNTFPFKDDSNPGDVKLVDQPCLLFAFLQTGFFTVLSGLAVYFSLFYYYNVSPSDLVNAAPDYFPASGDKVFTTHNGIELSPNRQDAILNAVQSGYYFNVAIMQFFTAYILKASDNVFCSKAAFDNKVHYAAFVFSLCIAFFVTHVPGVQTVLGSNYFQLWALLIPVGGGFLHVFFEGIKRAIMSK
mmetsp:Transcript_7445/g.11126  ORF Transcript_7445/g.11126 Transcript_7445/m.11126 type:complete len:1130 (+) Transcript_7445:49-3438(+)